MLRVVPMDYKMGNLIEQQTDPTRVAINLIECWRGKEEKQSFAGFILIGNRLHKVADVC